MNRPLPIAVRASEHGLKRTQQSEGCAMKVTVDRTRCLGLAMCEAKAPDVFEIDDDGALLILAKRVHANQLDAVTAAVDGCPTEALLLAED